MSMQERANAIALAQRVAEVERRLAALEANQERSATERIFMRAADEQSKQLARDIQKAGKRG